LEKEGTAFGMLGDSAGALARLTRVLGMAKDPATRGRMDQPTAILALASAHWRWVEYARLLTSIPVRRLFEALDAADLWLNATDHRGWRSAVEFERAVIHNRLDEHDAAIDCAKKALALALRQSAPRNLGFPLAAYRCTLGDTLHDAGRVSEAAQSYREVLDAPTVIAWGRYDAHRGLADCALSTGDPATARREAERAVQLAEPLGDDDMCNGLDRLGRACRAQEDLDAAWHAAECHLLIAARIGDHYFPYYATRNAADIALDRADHATTRRLLVDLDLHARAMDAAAETTKHTAAAARIRRRLGADG
jgi:tetratricopeptide (TPR) repeat protein